MSSLASDGTIRRGLNQSPAWQTVAQGLSWIFVGSIFSVVGLLLLLLTALVLTTVVSPSKLESTLLQTVLALSFLTILVSFLLLLIGQCFCCIVPEQSAARPLALGSLVCLLISTSLALEVGASATYISYLEKTIREESANRHPFDGRHEMISSQSRFFFMNKIGSIIISNLLALVHSILFLSFLYSIACYFERSKLMRSITHFIIFQICSFVIAFTCSFLLGFLKLLPEQKSSTIIVVMILAFYFTLFAIAVIWFLQILSRTQKAILLSLTETAPVIDVPVLE